MICYILGWFDVFFFFFFFFFFSQLYRLLGEERRRDVWRTLGSAGRKEMTAKKSPPLHKKKITGMVFLMSLFWLCLLLVRTGVLEMEGL